MKDRCFMIRPRLSGGGNIHMAPAEVTVAPIIVRRTAAIGDALCATVVADRLHQLGHEVDFQTHPNIHCVLRRHPNLYSVSLPGGNAHVNLDGAYEKNPLKKQKHFHQMFFDKANEQLEPRGINIGLPRNCKPRLIVHEHTRVAAMARFESFPRPWVFICPRSNSYAVRQVPDGVWQSAAHNILGTKFWLGTHPAPQGIVDLKCQHFDNVIEWLSVADLLVTVDTGPMHVAAALGIPVVAILQSSNPELHLSDQNDFIVVAPDLDCLGCMENQCPKDRHIPPCQSVPPARIAAAANARLSWSGKVSCVIPTHKAPALRLNRCLEAVIPQVSEVVVCADLWGEFPAGAIHDSRVKYVRHRLPKLGFGRNVNFGVRHTSGEFVLILNDDCYLDAGAVKALVDVAVADARVGIVGHLLRYPNGQICHGGKHRNPGMRGWGLTDNRGWIPTVRNVTEMENVTGTSILVRRQAFYDVNGFDEDFFMYAEDDAFSCQMRSRGWKVMYTPHATGIHEEAQTSKQSGDIMKYVREGNSIFASKWGWWIEKNINTVPGVFV